MNPFDTLKQVRADLESLGGELSKTLNMVSRAAGNMRVDPGLAGPLMEKIIGHLDDMRRVFLSSIPDTATLQAMASIQMDEDPAGRHGFDEPAPVASVAAPAPAPLRPALPARPAMVPSHNGGQAVHQITPAQVEQARQDTEADAQDLLEALLEDTPEIPPDATPESAPSDVLTPSPDEIPVTVSPTGEVTVNSQQNGETEFDEMAAEFVAGLETPALTSPAETAPAQAAKPAA